MKNQWLKKNEIVKNTAKKLKEQGIDENDLLDAENVLKLLGILMEGYKEYEKE